MTNGNILEKIGKIREGLEIQKTGYDERDEYYYFKADDIAAGVRAAMVEHGVVHRTEILSHEEHNYWDKNGRNRPRVTAHYRVFFISVDDGSEFATDAISTGSDIGGDKAPRKLAVQAFKIAAIDIFTIAEGMKGLDSDGDKEAPADVEEKTADEQATAQRGEKLRSAKELSTEIGQIITTDEGPYAAITADAIQKVGQRVADEMLGEVVKPTVWKKNAEVLTALISEVKSGAVS